MEKTEIRTPWFHIWGNVEWCQATTQTWQEVDPRIDNYISAAQCYRFESHQDSKRKYLFCTNGDIWKFDEISTKCM